MRCGHQRTKYNTSRGPAVGWLAKKFKGKNPPLFLPMLPKQEQVPEREASMDCLAYASHTGSKFEMDVATFGLDFLEECTTQGRTRSPSDGVPLFQGSFCSIIPWPIRWHEYDTLQMILGIFRHHGAHSCRLSGSNNLLMWLAQHGCLRTELNQFVANS